MQAMDRDIGFEENANLFAENWSTLIAEKCGRNIDHCYICLYLYSCPNSLPRNCMQCLQIHSNKVSVVKTKQTVLTAHTCMYACMYVGGRQDDQMRL
jgi:hypothetical protein